MKLGCLDLVWPGHDVAAFTATTCPVADLVRVYSRAASRLTTGEISSWKV